MEATSNISSIDERGVVEVLDETRYLAENPEADIVTCGHCGRSWDDEYDHEWLVADQLTRRMKGEACPNCGLPIGDEPGPADLPCDVCGQGHGHGLDTS